LGVADGGTTGEVLVVGMLADYVTELGMIVRSIGDAKSTLFSSTLPELWEKLNHTVIRVQGAPEERAHSRPIDCL